MRPLGPGSRLASQGWNGIRIALTLCSLNLSLSLDALTRPSTAPHTTTGRTMGRTGRIEYLRDNALKDE